MQAKTIARAAVWVAAVLAPTAALADSGTIRIARQLGANYLSMMVLEHERLVEKVAKERGLDVKVVWSQFAGGPAMNEALLSDNLDIASGGLPPFFILWDKTISNLGVRAVSARSTVAGYLITRNPRVKTLKDFSETDRIAVPAVKASMMAILLQIGAEKEFGKGQYARLDHLTVSMPNPEAVTAMLSGAGEITAQFTWAPFDRYLLRDKRNHQVLSSKDLFDGPLTTDVIWTTRKFHDANPKLYAAFVEAFSRATEQVNQDKPAAARLYLEMTRDKASYEEILKLVQDMEYTLAPKNVYNVANFMYRTGGLKNQPKSWKDLFFPELHHLSGS
jgi:NitT/TauT family transport system substrate-binding protein